MRKQWKANTSRAVGHQYEGGFTVLEALIAIVILALAFGTALAFHGNILGSAAENRLRTAAMMLAEEKIEQLRALPFANAALNAGVYSETLSNVSSFAFLGASPIALNRCWTIVDEPDLKRVQVSVARVGGACAPWSADALVTLSTRIARNDYIRAGLKLSEDVLYNPDGRGEIIPQDPDADPYVGAPPIEGGFDVLQYGEYGEFVVCDGASCLYPTPDEDGQQKFATINGNIFLSDRTCVASAPVGGVHPSLETRCELNLAIEGNGLCRLSNPDGLLAAPSIPGAGDEPDATAGFGYVRYSCVVADQWRRSITVLPRATEKVCSGNPVLVLLEGDPTDQLRASSRFYDGRAALLNVDGVIVDEYPHGLKGGPLEGPLRAVIGSYCRDGDDCWLDPDVRGLVPGGHHFMVMPATAGKCSERMSDLPSIDAEQATRYTGIFTRNPDSFFCTSAKTYGGDFCTSYTRVSGFIDNQASIDIGTEDINIVASGSQLLRPCNYFGPLASHGGAYQCGLRHNALGSSVAGVSNEPKLRFEGTNPYLFISPAPRDFPLDATARNFMVGDTPEEELEPVDPVDPVEPVDPVDPVFCNLTVTGTRPTPGNQWLSYYRYKDPPGPWNDAEGAWQACVNSGSNTDPTYECYRANAQQGGQMEIRMSRGGSHEDAYANFILNCAETNLEIDFR